VYVMVHVLAVESTNYAEHIVRGDVQILAGCVCARCANTELKLTNCWVRRGFQVRGDYEELAVVLARCVACKARERVLPCDALPGKGNGVANFFGALGDVQDGCSLTAAGDRAGVSRQCVRYWLEGVAHRYLDLARLHRHRAVIATSETDDATLVMFWAFLAEARTKRPTLSWPTTPSPPAAHTHEVPEATFAMVALLETAGGPLVVAEVGASLFQEAVLLFRSRGVSSSISVFGEDNFEHGGRRFRRRTPWRRTTDRTTRT